MNLYKCNSCTHPTSILPVDKQEPYNANYFVSTHKKWFENPQLSLYDDVFDLINKHIKKETVKICDVGCGTGSFLKHIYTKKSNWDLHGIDLVENDHDSIDYESGDFLKMEINKKYDVVTNFMVIEHVTDPHLFVSKMKISLKEDGLMVINTINSNSLIYRMARFLDKLGFSTAHDRLYDPHHLQHFNNESLKKLLEDEGMQIVSHKNHNYDLKAVDVPSSGFILEKMYLFVVQILFWVSIPFNQGHHQTILCEKKID